MNHNDHRMFHNDDNTYNEDNNKNNKDTEWLMEGGSDENEPKRRVLRRLGPRYVFF